MDRYPERDWYLPGHSWTLQRSEQCPSPIYLFIPFAAVLFSSGFVSGVRRGAGFGQFLKNKVPARLLPYSIFYLISYAFFINGVATTIGMSIGEVISVDHFRPYVIQPIIGLILVQEEWVTQIKNTTLWFLPCLLVVESVFFLLRQGMASLQRQVLLLPTAIVVSVAAFVLVRGVYPWNLDFALVSLVFYGFGYAVRDGGYAEIIPQPTGMFGRAVMLVGLALLSIIATFYPVRYGEHSLLAYLLYVIRALAGIALSIAAARLLVGYQPLRYFGRYSLLLLGTHLQIMTWAIAVIDLTVAIFTDTTIAVNDDIIAVLIALVTLILSIPCIEALRLLTAIFHSRPQRQGVVVR